MVTEELDDLSVRPHSASSVLRTFIGLHLRRIGGWISVADLVDLCTIGGNPGGTRSALSRLKSKGLVEPQVRDGRPGYRLTAAAVPMLERGDRRIFHHHRLDPEREGWLLAVFSIPDAERHLRHQLRQLLTWLGCGTITPGTWVGPGHLFNEATGLLEQRGLRDYVTLARIVDLRPPGGLAAAVAEWWDFADLTERYAAFLEAHRDTEREWDGSDKRAFDEHLRLVDDWRALPYLDPGLPAALTPPDWNGHRGVELFLRLQSLLSGPAARHVDATIASRTGTTP